MEISVIGMGLIGGSLAKALLHQGVSVSGYEIDPESVAAARADGFEMLNSPQKASDLCFLATPPKQTAQLLPTLLSEHKPNRVVCDLSSIKSDIIAAPLTEQQRGRFVPLHPLAGGTAKGYKASHADILNGCTWAVCPQPDFSALFAVAQQLFKLKAKLVFVEARQHDQWLAATSHLPQMISIALANSIPSTAKAQLLSGPGLRDMTRLAASQHDLWQQIIAANEHNIDQVLQQFIEQLESVKDKSSWETANDFREHLLRRRWQESASDYTYVRSWEQLLQIDGYCTQIALKDDALLVHYSA